MAERKFLGVLTNFANVIGSSCISYIDFLHKRTQKVV